MKSILVIVAFVFLLVYEKVWRPMICKKKIYQHIEAIGGEVSKIEKLTPRDEIYSIYYIENKQINHVCVQFNLFYKSTWK